MFEIESSWNLRATLFEVPSHPPVAIHVITVVVQGKYVFEIENRSNLGAMPFVVSSWSPGAIHTFATRKTDE